MQSNRMDARPSQTVARRMGYFLKETTSASAKGSGPRFLVRYFLIDNSKNLYYTEIYSQLVHLVRSSSRLRDLFGSAESQLKKIRMSEMKVSEVKKYKEPEILAFLNQSYFEGSLVLSSDLSESSGLGGTKVEEPKRLMFFAFKDYNLPLLHRFLSTYDKFAGTAAAQQEENESIEWNAPSLLAEKPVTAPKKQVVDKVAGLAEHLGKLRLVTETIERAESAGKIKTTVVQSKEEEQKNGAEIDKGKNENGQIEIGAAGEGGGEMVISGPQYSGPQVGGLAEGKGKEYLSDELSYVGEFRGGKRHGLGYFVVGGQGMCYVENMEGKVSGI
jgi:hypothetical protein